MAGSALQPVVQQLRVLAGVPATDERSDQELLARYIDQHDAEAFAVMARRHGPMVWAVCQRVLGHGEDADDACQATFLLLLRQARSIRRRASLASWLYGVALRVSRHALADAATRRRHERRHQLQPIHDPEQEAARRETAGLLDAELRALPEKYQAPLVLCYLEGQTCAQAAVQLGWSLRTLERRLGRARHLLRRRFERRGLVLIAVLTAAGLGAPTIAHAACPGQLAATVNPAARLIHMATSSARAGALADAALSSATASRIMILASLVLTVVVAASAGVVCYQRDTAKPAAQKLTVASPAQTPAHVDRYGDRLPAGAVARLGTTRLRAGQGGNTIAFAPDSRSFATGGGDGAVHIWDAATGREIRRIEGPKTPGDDSASLVLRLNYAPDGQTLAVARLNEPSALYAVTSGKQLARFDSGDPRDPLWETWVAFAPNGKLLAYGGGRCNRQEDKSVIHILDAATYREKRLLVGHRDSVKRPTFSADSKLLVSTSEDNTVRVWDVATGQERCRFAGGLFGLSPDGKRLAWLSTDQRLHLYDLVTNQQHELPGWQGRATGIAFSRHGNFLAVWAGRTRRCCLWKTAGEIPSSARKLSNEVGQVFRLGFTPDEKAFVTAAWDGTVHFWDTATGQQIRQFRTQDDQMITFALSPDGKTIVTGVNSLDDTGLRLWSAATGRSLVPRRFPEAAVWFLAFTPDGRRIATASLEGAAIIWETNTGRPLVRVAAFGPLAFLPDGRTLLIAGWADGIIHVVDAATGKEQRRFATGGKSWGGVAFAADGKTLATSRRGTQGWEIQFWNVVTGKAGRVLAAGPARPLHVCFSPDSKSLAVVSLDYRLRLWEVRTGRLLWQNTGTGPASGAIAFSPDGRLVAWSDGELFIHLADTRTGRDLWRLGGKPGLADALDTLAFSPDGRTLAWGGQHRNDVFVWEVATGLLRTRLHGHLDRLRCLAFSPDGSRLASGSTDTTALIWDMTSHTGTHRQPLTARQLQEAWIALADRRADVAYRAMCSLAASPDRAVELFRNHLHPVPRADARHLPDILHELDNNRFSVREHAQRRLEQIAAAIEPELRKVLANRPSAEVRARLERVLRSLDANHSLSRTRALEVLEWLGTAKAQGLLRELADGAAGARLTHEASAALERLAKRKPSTH